MIAVVLLLQGISHGKALFDLFAVVTGRDGGVNLPVRIWLLPSLTPKSSALIAGVFWLLATVGFVLASLGAFGSIDLGDAWKSLSGISAIISTIGIALVAGTSPAAHNKKFSNADTIIAVAIQPPRSSSGCCWLDIHCSVIHDLGQNKILRWYFARVKRRLDPLRMTNRKLLLLGVAPMPSFTNFDADINISSSRY